MLQELAEWASRADGIPVLLVTLQHLAFDEYVEGAIDRPASRVRRRSKADFTTSPSWSRPQTLNGLFRQHSCGHVQVTASSKCSCSVSA